MVFVGFDFGGLDFFAEFAERHRVGAFVLVQKFKNFLNRFVMKLFEDPIEVFAFVLPEINFDDRVWVDFVLEFHFRVLLENIFDLLGPCNNGA